MKIMFVAPRSISQHVNNQEPFRFDYAFWNFFLPLSNLGHTVWFFDTSVFGNKQFKRDFDNFKPDLIFCVMTGDKTVCPDEPWESIHDITEKGTCKTFNWFCDDTWRFDNFSSNVCRNFHFCSTTERSFLDRFLSIGYESIRYANWHSNPDVYSTVFCQKSNLLGFIGNLNQDRKLFISHLHLEDFQVANVKNASFEDMIHLYSSSLAGLNFTKSASDGKRQMKARIFEIPATRTLLLTERVDGIEEFFEVEKEIMTFDNEHELLEKVRWISSNAENAFKIALAGHQRYLRDHTSQVRLSNLLSSLS
jgi:spore maturation protein CgeB